jgi:hypothetical protein
MHVRVEATPGLGLLEALAEGCGLATSFEELVFQDLSLAQKIFVFQHVGAVSVYVSKDPVVPKLIQCDVYLYGARVASVKDP